MHQAVEQGTGKWIKKKERKYKKKNQKCCPEVVYNVYEINDDYQNGS